MLINDIISVNVDEWMQEVDSLSVQDLPRSASSLSVRTDASGTGVKFLSHPFMFVFIVLYTYLLLLFLSLILQFTFLMFLITYSSSRYYL